MNMTNKILLILNLLILVNSQFIAQSINESQSNKRMVTETYWKFSKTYVIDFLFESQANAYPVSADNKSEPVKRITTLDEINIKNYDIKNLIIRVTNTAIHYECYNDFIKNLNTDSFNKDSIVFLNIRVINLSRENFKTENDVKLDSFIIPPNLFKPFKNLKTVIISNDHEQPMGIDELKYTIDGSYTIMPNDDSFELKNLENLYVYFYGQNFLPDYLIAKGLKTMDLTLKCLEDTFILPTTRNMYIKESDNRKYGCRINIDLTEGMTKHISINLYNSNLSSVNFKGNLSSLSINLENSEISYIFVPCINSLAISGNNGLIDDFFITTTKKVLKGIMQSQNTSICILNFSAYIGKKYRLYIDAGLFRYRNTNPTCMGFLGGFSYNSFKKRKSKFFMPYIIIGINNSYSRKIFNKCYSTDN